MRRLLRYLLPYKTRILTTIIISLILAVFSLMDAWIMGRLSDAIFYRTKGIPISISWEKASNTATPIRLNLIKDSQWLPSEIAKARRILNEHSFTVKGLKTENSKMLTVETEVPSDLVKEPLRSGEEVEKYLKRDFKAIDVYMASGDQTEKKGPLVLFPGIYTIFLLPLLLVIVYFFKGIFKYAQSFLVGSVGQKLVMRLRNEIYQNLHNLSISYFERNSSGQSGQLISRVTNDIDAVYYLFSNGIVDMVLEPMQVVLGFAWGLYMNWKLTLMFFLVIPFVALPINKLSKKLRKINVEMMNKVADITGVLEETLAAIKVVKAFGMEQFEVNRFKTETRRSYHAALRSIRLGTFFSPIIDFLITIALAIFLTYGGSLIIGNQMTPGEFFSFIFLITVVGSPIRRISSLFSQLPRVMAASERVFELIDQKSEVVEAPDAIVLPRIKGEVKFEDVYFEYEPGKPVLQGINLTVRPGEVVALVGPSGAGKTTMINLVARFYDPVAGRVKIDGYDLRQLKIHSVRGQMGIVPQETMLFRGSVAENIAYGKPGASRDEIIAAAKAANAHEFIEKMPDGYDTKVGARGATLSGGQRQRIAIARALLRDPKVLILDEATSALDTQSEVLVQEALQRLMKDRTSFVIAHRLSTIRSADRIVVMDGGKIVEIGTHQELMDQGGLYAMLYRTQFQKREAFTQ